MVGAQDRLIDAVKANDAATVRTLLDKRVDVNAVQADGTTALHWAVDRDDTEIVQLLIRAGANVKATNRYGATPLWLASLNGNAVDDRDAARSRSRRADRVCRKARRR